MVLKEQGKVFIVKTKINTTDGEEYNKFYFHSLRAAEQFINGFWVVDVYGNANSMHYGELVEDVCERVDYSVEYE